MSYTVTEPKAWALLVCAGQLECNEHNKSEASGLTKGIRRQCFLKKVVCPWHQNADKLTFHKVIIRKTLEEMVKFWELLGILDNRNNILYFHF